LALIAELIAGEIGRVLGLRVPEIVFVDIDPALGRNEPDAEIRHLLRSSPGLNLALDYLPGSIMFDPAARDTASAEEASMLVWFDAFTQNVDRTPRNANLLVWHRKLYPIDHGAALFFHHDWETMEKKIESPFAQIEQHVLLPWATEIANAGSIAREKLTAEAIGSIVGAVPDEWLDAIPGQVAAAERRAAYADFFLRRLAAADIFEQEATNAHSRLV
jgi:hypothetical protein